MKTLYLALLVSVITGAVWSSAVCASDVEALITQAQQMIDEQDYEGARAAFNDVITQYPTSEKVWHAKVKLAECSFHQKKYDECILEARKIVNLYPASAPQVQASWAQLYIGLACAEKNDTEAAKWEFSKVEAITGDNPDRGALIQARNSLALIYHGENNRVMSANIAKEIIADTGVAPNDRAWAEVILGYALVGDKKTTEGLDILYNVRENYPQCQEPLLTAERKILDTILGQHDWEAVTRLCTEIMDDPGACETRAKQAGSYLVRKLQYTRDYENALSQVRILMDRFVYSGEEQCEMLRSKARLLALTKHYNQAIETYEAALATNPTDAEICGQVEWDMATCYRLIGDYAQADEHLTRIVDLYPESYLADRASDKLQGR